MSDFDDDTSPRSSRSWLFIAAGVVVLIVAMGVFASIVALTDDDQPSPNSPPADAAAEPTTPADPTESVCGLPGYEKEGPLTEPPEDATWTLVGKVALPETETAGPGIFEESGLRYCYAHTPAGALLAAANTYAWNEALFADPVGVVEHSVASGPGYEAAMQLAQTDGSAKARPDLLIQIRGFRLLAYDGSTALVDLASQTSDGAYLHQRFELVWEEGDWRLRLAPDGSAPSAEPLPDLTGYIPFTGA